MAREAVRRGIVETISRGSIGRFLKEADLKPHRVRGSLASESASYFACAHAVPCRARVVMADIQKDAVEQAAHGLSGTNKRVIADTE